MDAEDHEQRRNGSYAHFKIQMRKSKPLFAELKRPFPQIGDDAFQGRKKC